MGKRWLSVSDVDLMKRIAALYGASSPREENEDIFFVRRAHSIKDAVLPSRETSYRFCREVELKEFPHITHHASLHAAWYYCPRAMQDASSEECKLFDSLRK